LSLIAEFIAARSERAGLKIHCLQLLEKERQAASPPSPPSHPFSSLALVSRFRSIPRRWTNYPRRVEYESSTGRISRLSRADKKYPRELAGSPGEMILARATVACARLRTYVCMIATDRCISLGMHLRACWTSFAETLMDKRGLYGRREGARRGRLHIYVMTPLHST